MNWQSEEVAECSGQRTQRSQVTSGISLGMPNEHADEAGRAPQAVVNVAERRVADKAHCLTALLKLSFGVVVFKACKDNGEERGQ